ncbi:perforin-1-like [Mobula birostris]|uniref:perforin-1-like n=1 Tax=Mobula birostris TaxID=1983395 RepID=UPI003B28C9C8
MDPRMGERVGILLWTLLFLGGVGATCETGSARECQSAPPVPGSSLAGEGFDVVTLSRKGAYVVNVESWSRRDGACTLCRNSLMGGRRQRLPLATVDWRALRDCPRAVSSQLFHSLSELIKSISSSVDNSWSTGLNLPTQHSQSIGSKSKLMSFATRKTKSDCYSFAKHEFRCRLYRYRLKDQPPLAPQFSARLNQITNTSYEEARHHYRQLVQTFGTHFIRSVDMGGSFQDVTAIRTCQAAVEGITPEQVKDCLGIEASYQVVAVGKGRAGTGFCKKKAWSLNQTKTFHQAFNERLTEAVGGHSSGDTDILFSSDPASFTRWLKSLEVSPGIIKYQLAPLHLLLPITDRRREQLRLYLSEYILANAMKRDCSKTTCPAPGSKSRSDPCSSQCQESFQVDNHWCSTWKGTGHLLVTIKSGFGLWGDYLSGTDGFVVVSYGNAKGRTRVINNNNNPTWNTRLDLGVVVAHSNVRLTLVVYDEDIFWNERLGTCKVPLISGVTHRTCHLKHGMVTYKISFTCGRNLYGRTCHRCGRSPGAHGFTGLLRTNHSSHPSDSPTALPSGNALLKVINP